MACGKTFRQELWICKLTIMNLILRWNDILCKPFRLYLGTTEMPAQLNVKLREREIWFSTESLIVLYWLAGFLWIQAFEKQICDLILRDYRFKTQR